MRSKALEDSAAQHNNWNIIEQLDGDFTEAKGYEVVRDYLKENRNIDVIYSENDNMTFGAMKALDEAGITYGEKVKAVIRQVSHSKKWVSDVPMTDGNGAPVLNASGKPVFVKSYSVLQDRLFEHMRAAGFTGFERGVRGSTAEHLTSLQYQIAKDMERLNAIDRKVADTEERLAQVEVEYAEQAEIHKTYSEIDEAGKKSLGRYVMSKEDYRDLTALAKEGISSRGRIGALQRDVSNVQEQNWSLRTCSRLVVMRDRKVVGELSGEDLTQNKIMATIAGGEE